MDIHQAQHLQVLLAQNTNLSDMGDDYYFPSAALKLQVNRSFFFWFTFTTNHLVLMLRTHY